MNCRLSIQITLCSRDGFQIHPCTNRLSAIGYLQDGFVFNSASLGRVLHVKVLQSILHVYLGREPHGVCNSLKRNGGVDVLSSSAILANYKYSRDDSEGLESNLLRASFSAFIAFSIGSFVFAAFWIMVSHSLSPLIIVPLKDK